MRVATYDPFRQLDRLFTTPAIGSVAPRITRAPAIPLDVVRHPDRVELAFDLPGVDIESVDLTVDNLELTLRAERSFSVPDEATQVRSERRHGELTRTLVLAEDLDVDSLAADYANGVLTVTIPVVETASPRRIEIERAG